MCRVSQSARRNTSSSGKSGMPCPAANAASGHGSYATTSMPNALPRRATALPVRPSPATPRVVPRKGRLARRGHSPALMSWCCTTTFLASARMSAKVCSATASWFVPGANVTATPWSVAASKSTPSKPTPARAITFNPCPAAAAMTARVYGSDPARLAAQPGSWASTSASDIWALRVGNAISSPAAVRSGPYTGSISLSGAGAIRTRGFMGTIRRERKPTP